MITFVLDKNKYETDKYLLNIRNSVEDFDFSLLNSPNLEELNNICNLSPLASDKRVVFIYFLSHDLKENYNFFNKVIKTTWVYLIETEIDKRTSFYKEVSKNYEFIEFNLLNLAELKKFVTKVSEIRNVKFNREAMDFFLFLTGSDQYTIENELNKFPSNTTITSEDINQKTCKTSERKIFDVIDNIFNGKKNSIMEVTELIENNNFDFIRLVNMLIWKIRQLIKIKQLLNEGKPDRVITETLGIVRFSYDKDKNTVSKYSMNDLLSIYVDLEYCDVFGKTNTKDKMIAFYKFLERVI